MNFGFKLQTTSRRLQVLEGRPTSTQEDDEEKEKVETSSVRNWKEIMDGSQETCNDVVIPLPKNETNQEEYEHRGIHGTTADEHEVYARDWITRTLKRKEMREALDKKPHSKNELNSRMEHEEEFFRQDIEMRPEEASLGDYERIPVDIFGLAMLKGMGYVKGQRIGRRKKMNQEQQGKEETNEDTLCDPIEYVPRPLRLGLGAVPKALLEKEERMLETMNDKKKKIFVKPGEKREDKERIQGMQVAAPVNGKARHYKSIHEKLVDRDTGEIKVGHFVKVLKGIYEGMEGKVIKLDRQHVHLYMKINEQTVVFPILDVLRLDSSNRNIPSLQENQVFLQPSSSSLSNPSASSSALWLRPHLRVRMISKTWQLGRYFTKKGIIMDVLRKGDKVICDIQFEEGHLMQGIDSSMLETVIPPLHGQVIIVQTNYLKDPSMLGEVGTILEKNNEKMQAILQLTSTMETLTVDYDDICEYIPT